jgi:hypothetical protein
MLDDPFDTPAVEVPRDRHKRPIILRPWESDGDCPEPGCHITKAHGHYTRASTFAGYLDDGIALSTWRARHIALSVARRPDLAARVAGMTYADPELPDLIHEALERAKDDEASLQASAWGTAMHRFTEPDSPPHAPEVLRSDVEAYAAAMDKANLSVIATEQFVVNDMLKVAGTFDHLVSTGTGCPIVLDKKTGKIRFLSQAVQIAVYATGSLYDIETGERSPIHPDIDTSIGLLAHIPLGQAACSIYPVDLESAYAAAHLADRVRDARSAARSWFGPASDRILIGSSRTIQSRARERS